MRLTHLCLTSSLTPGAIQTGRQMANAFIWWTSRQPTAWFCVSQVTTLPSWIWICALHSLRVPECCNYLAQLDNDLFKRLGLCTPVIQRSGYWGQSLWVWGQKPRKKKTDCWFCFFGCFETGSLYVYVYVYAGLELVVFLPEPLKGWNSCLYHFAFLRLPLRK